MSEEKPNTSESTPPQSKPTTPPPPPPSSDIGTASHGENLDKLNIRSTVIDLSKLPTKKG